jgi:hypothetical protein
MEVVEGTLVLSVLKYVWCLRLDFEICLLSVYVALKFLQKHLTSIMLRVFDEDCAYRPKTIFPVYRNYFYTKFYAHQHIIQVCDKWIYRCYCRLSVGRLGSRDLFPSLGKVSSLLHSVQSSSWAPSSLLSSGVPRAVSPGCYYSSKFAVVLITWI